MNDLLIVGAILRILTTLFIFTNGGYYLALYTFKHHGTEEGLAKSKELNKQLPIPVFIGGMLAFGWTIAMIFVNFTIMWKSLGLAMVLGWILKKVIPNKAWGECITLFVQGFIEAAVAVYVIYQLIQYGTI